MKDLNVLRLDDLPLLYSQVKGLGVQRMIDDIIQPHGNWRGLSIGEVVAIWLCYMLSEADHRLSSVEEWVVLNHSVLSVLSGESVAARDFTDDRLEQVLDYLSDPGSWRRINNKLNSRGLEVYAIEGIQPTIRVDAAPFQGHHDVKVSGLFEHGYSKHHNPKLGMLKVMLGCLDNEINGFGYPLAHLTVSGEKADDVLYIDIVAQCEASLPAFQAKLRKLYVGDSKMGSKANRYYILSTNNDYLMPLSKVQLSDKMRAEAISKADSKAFKKAYKLDGKGKKHLIAEGFEHKAVVSYEDENGQIHKWEERRVFVRSTAYANSQQTALANRLEQTTAALNDLLVSKQGKKTPGSQIEVEQAVSNMLKDKNLTGLLEVRITEQKHSRQIRAYKDKPARREQWSTFELEVKRNESLIEERKKLSGWQVYGTTVKEQTLDFENIIWKYRHQNRIETRFNDLRNKVVPLMPVFLKKDNRVEALINLLMVCLKLCALMEFKVARNLKKNGEQLDRVYEGNPKRATATPTAKRLLKQFKGISMVSFKQQANQNVEAHLTELSQNQLKIIRLMDEEPDIYTDLPRKIKLFFSNSKIPET